ncbi:amidohydrolase family protein [Pontixanthobacter aestiaquae]|uniref:Amidohydrolase family protein n=1 Tax=Pontixanthobacter aestiaquae TaxID=1509367 RepID=A0A844Z5X3_9SPHN|nr:amidohydrolase family protein [Pontixanthobacter aestiaquae]MDN3646287.1 amidohydrolase family protein [Pontixanthobacter aestiaquae]MXO82722.1 amidohydrolase family protein [Pontixanthobacter aestiaquae]
MIGLHRAACAVGTMLGLASCQTVAADAASGQTIMQQVDLLITGGAIYDGSGGDAVSANLAIDDGEIIAIFDHDSPNYRGVSTIDARGLVVAPGFIDPHTHATSDLASNDEMRRANLPFAHQGVTTVVIGNDGFGDTNIAELASRTAQMGVGTNVAFLAGFGPIREAVLGTANRAPTSTELTQMKAAMRSAMCDGAWGLSTGLYYVPQNYAKTDEVIALAKIAGEFGGYYDTHMRDESTYNITVSGAVQETIEIGVQAALPVHIAHIKALGPEVWGHSSKMIAAIEEARSDGLRVTADQYPWAASGTRISNALVPRWALEGGLARLRERLSVEEEAKRIRNGMIAGLERRGGADRLLITAPLGGIDIVTGITLADIAKTEEREPVDSAIAILKQGDARLASFNMNEADIAAFAVQDWVVTGSDGSTGHPRKYASFPKAYRDLVKKEGMPLARFIRRSSGKTAEIIGLTDRGYLKPGYAADVVVFDPEEFAPVASYQNPRELSVGVRHLLVNGALAIKDGRYTGALSGKPLLKQSPASITACD